MKEIVNNFLLAGDKFMSQMHLKQPAALRKQGFTYIACEPLLKTKKEFRISKKQEIKTIFTKMNLITLLFNMI